MKGRRRDTGPIQFRPIPEPSADNVDALGRNHRIGGFIYRTAGPGALCVRNDGRRNAQVADGLRDGLNAISGVHVATLVVLGRALLRMAQQYADLEKGWDQNPTVSDYREAVTGIESATSKLIQIADKVQSGDCTSAESDALFRVTSGKDFKSAIDEIRNTRRRCIDELSKLPDSPRRFDYPMRRLILDCETTLQETLGRPAKRPRWHGVQGRYQDNAWIELVAAVCTMAGRPKSHTAIGSAIVNYIKSRG